MSAIQRPNPKQSAILESFYEEDASCLVLPKIEPEARIASISDVYLILKDRMNDFTKQTRNAKRSSEMFKYCEKVAKFKNDHFLREAEAAIARAFDAHPYEIVTLVNLLPKNSEEAKCLIPTLDEKITDDKLQDLLDRLWEIQDCETCRNE
ncbi:hypothetical protein ACOME3_006636 [Neoechinorhynchus agilis]